MLEMQKRLRKPFYALMTLPATAMGFGLAVQIAALSALMRDKYNLNLEEIGFVWAAGPIAGILGQVIIGMISDKTWFWGGRRRPFILIGGSLSAISLLALPNIGLISQSLGLLDVVVVALVVALTLDLSINVGFNPTRSIISDLTPEGEARTRGFTWMQTVSGTFGVVAYALGRIAGNEFLIYFAVGLVLLFAVVPVFFMEEPRELASDDETASRGGFDLGRVIIATLPLWAIFIFDIYAFGARLLGYEREGYLPEILAAIATAMLITWVVFLKKPKPGAGREDLTEFQKIMAAHSFSWIGVQSMFVFFYPYLEHVIPEGGETLWAGTTNLSFLVLNLVGALLPAFILNPLARRIPRVRIQALCLGVMAAGYAAIYLAGTSPFALYALMAIVGVGWAAIVSLPFAILSQRINQARMGLFMGIFNLSVVLPQLAVSMGVGRYLNSIEDKSMLFAIASASLALSALLWLRVHPLPTKETTE